MKLRNDRREERRWMATKRNEAWRSLTPREQLRSLAGRRGDSKRQYNKLSKILEPPA